MARKRSNLIEDPPTASSSEEEEEEKAEAEVEAEAEASSEEEEGSSSEEEEEEEEEEPRTQTAPQTQKAPPPKKPEIAAPATVADESDESGSDDDSESDTDSPTPNVKPIATKPMEETSNAKKPRSKPLTSPVKASSAKRPSESEQESKDAKRPKKKAGDEGTGSAAVAEEVKKTGEDAKKQLFQRLFSEDDEIAVLKGMLDYHAKKGADPCADMNAFHDFVRKSIHIDVSKAQLMDKIRRLRKKFENNAVKGKKGEDKVFNKPHEQKAFDLSKKIWGKDGITGKVESSAAKSNGKAKGNNSKALAALKAEMLSSPEKKVDVGEPMDVDKKGSKSGVSFFDKRFSVANLEGEVLKHGLEVIGGEKRAALEQKWKKLQIAEMELFLERSELIKEQAKMLLEFYKSEDK